LNRDACDHARETLALPYDPIFRVANAVFATISMKNAIARLVSGITMSMFAIAMGMLSIQTKIF